MRYIFIFLTVFISASYAVTADQLVGVHKVTTTEMNSINLPATGSLIYNTSESSLFVYTGTAWKKLRAEGSETVITGGNQIVITGNGSDSTPYIIGK